MEVSAQILLSKIIPRTGSGFTVIFTESDLLHPVILSVSVNINIVVTCGNTEMELAEEEKLFGVDIQEYLFKLVALVPNLTRSTLKIVLLAPVMASGNGLIVTFMLSLLLHPVARIVSVKKYVVELAGITEFPAYFELKPGGSDIHLKLFPIML